MTDPPVPPGEPSIRWRDGLLLLPWIGLALAGFQGPHAGWALLGPVFIAGAPIALYFALERFAARRGGDAANG